MQDIRVLETTGVQVNIPERGEITIFGSMSQFCWDCLAINESFGLVSDFSHNYHCLFCYCTKISSSSVFKEDQFELRTKLNHIVLMCNSK